MRASQVNASTVLELDPLDGRLKPLLDDSPWLPGLQLAIDAGGARVFALEPLARGAAQQYTILNKI